MLTAVLPPKSSPRCYPLRAARPTTTCCSKKGVAAPQRPEVLRLIPFKLDTKGPVCQRFGEDCGHVFFKCKYVKLCWHELDMEDIKTELPNRQSGKEIITIH